MNILAAIGKTPLVEIKHVVPPNSARILGKLEWANPTGSMKDLPPLWDPELVNEIMTVSTAQAKTMVRRQPQEEGVFTGTSSGANVARPYALRNAWGRRQPSRPSLSILE